MQLIQTKFSSKLLMTLLKELFRGKSLARTLLNFNLRDVELSGEILDLGSKSNSASYNRFLRHRDPYKVTYTDWHIAGEDIIRLNLEEDFKLENNKFDAITCFNVLEHIYNYKNLIKESHRVLRQGGLFVGGTPFLINYHADPHDYFRYTHEAINRMFSEAGFRVEKMVYLGYGPIFASLEMQMHIFPRVLRPFLTGISLLFDYIILKLKKSQRLRYPLGYTYIFRKK